jgi:DNA-binding response OmpR family regulator
MPETTKHTILIVEDDPALLRALADKLAREDFLVLQAKDGLEGLTTAQEKHPNLILLDIAMPRMDGLTMMKKLRTENEWGENVPIILLTNLSSHDEKINAGIAEDEPAYFFEKSDLDLDNLVKKIHERLDRK